jgi:hypothetical protein
VPIVRIGQKRRAVNDLCARPEAGHGLEHCQNCNRDHRIVFEKALLEALTDLIPSI